MNATAPSKRLGRPRKVRPVAIRSVELVRESPIFVLAPDANLARQRGWALEGIAQRATDAGLSDVAAKADEHLTHLKQALSEGGIPLIVAQENAQTIIEWGERQLGYAAANAGRRHGPRKETTFDDLASEATAFLDLPTTTKRGQRAQELGHGVAFEPINRGLDVLECRGERVEEIRKWRERKGGKPGSPWLLSPMQRDRLALNSRDAAWFDRLKASGWTAQ